MPSFDGHARTYDERTASIAGLSSSDDRVGPKNIVIGAAPFVPMMLS